MIPISVACASLVSVRIGDLKREGSWLLATEWCRVDDVSSRPGSVYLGSCGGKGLKKDLLGRGEGGADVADRDGHKLHPSPNC